MIKKSPLALLACLVAVSCIYQMPSEENDDDIEVTGLNLEINEMKSYYDKLPETRTSVARVPDGFEFVWSKNDSIGIFPKTGGQVAFAVVGDNSRYCDFDGGGWGLKSTSTYSAYFPLIGDFYLDKTRIPVDISGQVQNGNGSTAHLAAEDYLCCINSKVGSDGKVKMQFNHLINVLHFKIKVPEAGRYTSVELTSDKPFVEKGTFNLTDGTVNGNKSVDKFAVGLKNVSFNAPGGVIEVFMVMFPINLTGSNLYVTAVREDGMTYSIQIDGRNYEAGIFYNYSERSASHYYGIDESVDYTEHQDFERIVENPHKGWYHHYYSNNLKKYPLTSADDAVINSFPGLDHIYIRIAWSYLEPTEGKYDWSLIDNIINKYGPMGYGFSVRITCRETGSVGQLKNGCYYATPYWVVQAGATGTKINDAGTNSSWSPDYGNSIFLKKLENFHKAFAARYDSNPNLRYVDIGSVGDWGEGHTSSSTDTEVPVDVVKKHLDIFARCYHNTPVIVNENMITSQRNGGQPYWSGSPAWPANEIPSSIIDLVDYSKSYGFDMRCDGFMVDWYLTRDDANGFHWSVMRPYMFEYFYKDHFIVHEEDHYNAIKEAGDWKGVDGKEVLGILGHNTNTTYYYSGHDIFMKTLEISHPTYIGYHGTMNEWLSENPGLAVEAANKCGYWISPVMAELQETTLKVKWFNNGVAPCYHPYLLRLHFIDRRGQDTVSVIEDSGNLTWMPGETTEATYQVDYSSLKPGTEYTMYMELYDPSTQKSIDVALEKTYLNGAMIPVASLKL